MLAVQAIMLSKKKQPECKVLFTLELEPHKEKCQHMQKKELKKVCVDNYSHIGFQQCAFVSLSF